MKGKKFYVALIGLFIIGIGSIYFYRQEQEARALEFEGYEISTIESRVDGLYNAEKTDIQEDIVPELKELEQIFDELNEKDLSYRSEKWIEELEENFLTAREMHELQEEIGNLYGEDDIVNNNASLDVIEELETSLTPFEDKTIYYQRNSNYILDARVQVETLEEATKRVEKLTSDEVLLEDIDEEELEELEELIAQIKDEELKNDLLEQIASVRTALAEMEAELEEEVEVVSEDTEDLDEEELESEEVLEEELEEVENEELPEEVSEEESVETVQETTQAPEQPNNSTPQPTNPVNNAQQPSSNNNRTNTSPSNRSSSGTSRNQTSTPANKPTNNQTNKQPDTPQESQENKKTNDQNKKEEKAAEKRPAVERKYTETKVVKEIPFETFTYKNANIAAGEEIVYREGHPGQVIETYEVTVYRNGNTNRALISKDETQPENRVVTIGTKEPETASE